MGWFSSDEETNQQGEQKVDIVQNQKIINAYHRSHNSLLWIILCLIVINLAWAVYKALLKKQKLTAIKAAKSAAAANEA